MNLNKNVELVSLFDLYGNLLTDKQKQVFELSVLQDLSLKEVSDLLNISRQAVKFSLDNSTAILKKTESQLHILSKFDKIKEKLNRVSIKAKEDLKVEIEEILEEM